MSGTAPRSAPRSVRRQVPWIALLAAIVAAPRAPSALALGPGRFVENRGQWPEPARYACDLGAAVLRVDDGGFWLNLVPWATVVRVDLPASPARRVEARGLEETRWHFFVGDPAQWRSDLRCFSEVVWRDETSGRALRARAQAGGLHLEEEGESGPPLRPDYRGVDRVELRADGGRRLSAGNAWLVEAPVSPDGRRWSISWEPAFAGHGDTPARFDPDALRWGTYLGGAHNDYGQAVALDSAGRPVLCGYTSSGDFPTTPGAYDRTHAGSYDVFVAKMSADGSALLWASYIGGALEDRSFDLELDDAGRVVVVGHTFSSDFPTTPGAFDRTLGGFKDAFACKLSASGDALLWSTYLGGAVAERAFMVRLAPDGTVVAAGETSSSDFPLTADAFDATLGGTQDAFALRLAESGAALLYGTFLGGGGYESMLGLALDSEGRAVVTGFTQSNDYPVTAGAYDITPGGASDAFVSLLELGPAGVIASTRLGGAGDDACYGVGFDAAGRIHLAGSTQSSDFPTTPLAADRTWNGSDDAFYACFDGSLASLLGSTFLGGTGSDIAFALALDRWGFPILTGETGSPDFPTTPDGYAQNHTWERDAFVTRLDPQGPALSWSTCLGGNDYDAGWDLEASQPGRVIVSGPTRSLDFPTTPGAYDRSYNGDQQDLFAAELAYLDGAGLPSPPASARSLLEIAPNPSGGEIVVRVRLERSREVSVTAHDAEGREVAAIFRGRLPAGAHALSWDGTAADGAPLPAGTYWLRCAAENESSCRRIVRIR